MVNSDCGVGRLCSPAGGLCLPFCTSDSDCRTGVCDLYSKYCGGAHPNGGAGGLLAHCSVEEDCRSYSCTLSNDPWYPKRCDVDCLTDVPGSCPENAVCVPLLGTYGTCVPPCRSNDSCQNPELTCYELKDFATPVCLDP